ncbi:MAG: hypothetical protein ABSG90_05540 [Dehalococcoidia bacterium]|jgi:hypothetical protein
MQSEDLIANWRQSQYINLITIFDAGNIPLKSRQEQWMWCADSIGIVNILIVPKFAWDKVKKETNAYSKQISVVPICLGINTDNPFLLPATIPDEYALKLQAIKQVFQDTFDISLTGSKFIRQIFSNITPVQFDNGEELGIALSRIKYPRDLYTRLENDVAISIIHTCLANDKLKPYSFFELYGLKMKAFKRWVSE